MEAGERSQIGTVIHWGATGVIALVGFHVQLLLFLASMFDKNKKLPGRFYRKMGWWAAKLSPMWKFKVVKPIPEYRPKRTVVVGNHQSQADPFLISGLPWEMKWLGKRKLFKIPFVGWSMVLAGDIPLNRGNRESAIEAMGIARDYLQRDMPVMIFPEGTRSRDGNLLPFKTGAFRLAIENEADVLPVAVAGTRFALPKGSMHPGKSNAVVTVGSPISTDGMTLDDIDRLIEMTRQQIQDMRQKLIPLSSEAGSTLLTE
jgi:1-acyl-sn-glycerol-3-phosphate acyltransferase